MLSFQHAVPKQNDQRFRCYSVGLPVWRTPPPRNALCVEALLSARQWCCQHDETGLKCEFSRQMNAKIPNIRVKWMDCRRAMGNPENQSKRANICPEYGLTTRLVRARSHSAHWLHSALLGPCLTLLKLLPSRRPRRISRGTSQQLEG